MGDKSCQGDHERHLCSLAKKKRVDDIRPLVTDPQYICLKCGRVADEEKRLCRPDSIKK